METRGPEDGLEKSIGVIFKQWDWPKILGVCVRC